MSSTKWTPTIVASVLGGGVWLLAALDGHGLEMIWLPAVVVGAAWPQSPHYLRACLRRLRGGETLAHEADDD